MRTLTPTRTRKPASPGPSGPPPFHLSRPSTYHQIKRRPPRVPLEMSSSAVAQAGSAGATAAAPSSIATSSSMDSAVSALVGSRVCIVTLDGRSLIGVLKGFDGMWNLVLENAFERLFFPDRGMEEEPLGLYLVRGDSLCVSRGPRARPRSDDKTRRFRSRSIPSYPYQHAKHIRLAAV